MSHLIGRGGFAGGIATYPRVNPEQSPSVFETLDGYTVESGSLKPFGGSSLRQSALVANTIAMGATPRSPYCTRVGTSTVVFAVDANDVIRFIKPETHTPGTPALWSAARADLTADLRPGSRMIRAGDQLILPCTDGLKRLELPWIIAAPTTARVFDLCIPAPPAAPSASGAYPPQTYVELMSMESTETISFNYVEDDGGISPEYMRAYRVTGGAYKGSSYTRLAKQADFNHETCDDVWMFRRTFSAPLDLTAGKQMVLGLRLLENYAVPETDHLEIVFYSDTAYATPVLTVPFPLFTELGAWKQVTIPIADASALGAVQGMAVRVVGEFSILQWNFDFDDIVMHMTEDGSSTYWPDDDTTADYCYCYAGPERRTGTNPRWVISNPSPTLEAVSVTPGCSLAVGLNAGTVRNTCDVSHLFLYRRLASETDFSYVASLPLAGVANGAAVSFTDNGGVLEGDDELLLPAYLEADHDPAATAGYEHVIWIDQRLYAAGPSYALSAVEASQRSKPWYWDTFTDGTNIDAGGRLEGYTVTGSRVNGLAQWRSRKVVQLDTEMFMLDGDMSDLWAWVYLDSVGTDSARSQADCRDQSISHAVDNWYAWGGGAPKPISQHKLSASSLDLAKPHDAVHWSDRYVMYGTYAGAPSLLIYELALDSWVRHSCPEMAGICCDRATGKLYGLTWDSTADQAWIVELNSGTKDWAPTEEGYAYVDRTYTIRSLVWNMFAPLRAVDIGRLVMDIDAAHEGTLAVKVYSYGPKAENKSYSVTLDPLVQMYDADTHLLGVATRIEITYTGDYPPTFHYIGLDTPGVPR